MKKLVTLFLFFIAVNASSQSKDALETAIRNYCRCMPKYFSAGNPVLRDHMHRALSAQGYSHLEILKGMEKLRTDEDFRVATYRAWQRLYEQKVTVDFNLVSIGMNSRDAQTMQTYIKKFNDQDKIGREENNMLFTGNIGPKYIPVSSFTNLVLPVDQGRYTGKVAVLITVNDNGKVIKALTEFKGTTIADGALWQSCRDALLGAALNQTAVNSGLKSGIVVFNFKVKE